MIKYHLREGGFEESFRNKKDLIVQVLNGWGGRIRTSEMAGPKPAALPLGDAPSCSYIYNIISRLNVKGLYLYYENNQVFSTFIIRNKKITYKFLCAIFIYLLAFC